LGITLLEMICGQAPYEGELEHRQKQLILANGKPHIPNMQSLDPDLQDILDRRLQLDHKIKANCSRASQPQTVPKQDILKEKSCRRTSAAYCFEC
jgi:serine/threonine protein kinase